ncbi:uncharacterized protein [Parasteatoda tepidariorum]|uniref:uncharacterized protein n=1 Tax=Parasteatoda tepidariorum TaxID=114398 RepID=UPI0039BC2956
MDYRLAFAFCFLILEFRSVTNLSVPSICLEVITDKPMLKYLCGKFLSSLLAVENQNEPGAPSHSDPGAPSHSDPGAPSHSEPGVSSQSEPGIIKQYDSGVPGQTGEIAFIAEETESGIEFEEGFLERHIPPMLKTVRVHVGQMLHEVVHGLKNVLAMVI